MAASGLIARHHGVARIVERYGIIGVVLAMAVLLYALQPEFFLSIQNVTNVLALMQRAAQAGYTHMLVNDSKFCRLATMDAHYFYNLGLIKQAATNLNLEIVPTIFPVGYSNDLLRHHMELRGIGIIDIKDLFGVASTRDVKPIDLVVRLEKWVEGTEYDRLGITGETFELLGVTKPYVRLPVASGRNLALLVEIAARNHLMKLQGYDSARAFLQRIISWACHRFSYDRLVTGLFVCRRHRLEACIRQALLVTHTFSILPKYFSS